MNNIWFICDNVIGLLIAPALNDAFVGVTEDDLTNMPYLTYIDLGILFINIFIVFLIPLRKEIEFMHQEVRESIRISEKV